jgi:competence ComEA-like helix-hairpin-helix protein
MRRFCAWGLAVSALLAGALATFAQKQPPAKPLDLNTATVEQLTQLPGVGPVTAKAIVDFRTKSGPFRRVEDLLAIRGITERRLKELRPYVTVQPAKSAGFSKIQAHAKDALQRRPSRIVAAHAVHAGARRRG